MALHKTSTAVARAADMFDEDSGSSDTCHSVSQSLARVRDTVMLRANRVSPQYLEA